MPEAKKRINVNNENTTVTDSRVWKILEHSHVFLHISILFIPPFLSLSLLEVLIRFSKDGGTLHSMARFSPAHLLLKLLSLSDPGYSDFGILGRFSSIHLDIEVVCL